MNVQRDPDAILAAWLEEGPTGLPEPTRRAIAVSTRTTNQRRHPIWVPQRRPSMNPFARVAVAAVALVVLIGGAIYAFAPGGGGVGGPPAASATPASSPSVRGSATPQASTSLPSPSPAILADSGDVFPGTYVTRFEPALTITIDREVENGCATGYRCRGSIDTNINGWVFFEFGNSPPDHPAFEVGVTRVDKIVDLKHSGALIAPPADLAGWIAKYPGLTVLTPPSVVKVGGLDEIGRAHV